VGFSITMHALFARGMARLPPRAKLERPCTLTVRIVEPSPVPPPEPEPEKPPEPAKMPPDKLVHEPPQKTQKAKPAQTAVPTSEPPKEAPPSERPASTSDTTDTPAFGISLESTSQGGAGPGMRVGNTLQVQPKAGASAAAKAQPLATPVQAYEVTRMPLPKGRCSGKYTEEAREAAIEGTVLLDLVVGEDGRTRDITVVTGLGHGLTEAAVSALKACRFTPGERDGKAVPVRVRGFKIHFFLKEGGQ
jgi:protein TonB